MKTIYPISKIFIFITTLFMAASCDSFVEVDTPKSQLISPAVFEDYQTADAALTDIYSSIRNKGILTGYGSGISNTLGNYADEIRSVENPNNPSISFYNNLLLASNSSVAVYWNASYNQIYAANSIIEGSSTSKTLTADQKKHLRAEALFIRALLHFYIINLFGDAPFISQTDYKINSIAVRTSIEKVYQSIIRDLEEAVVLLPENYYSTERVRPNKFVAAALLARVYLYTMSYAEASNTASEVINKNELYQLEPQLSNVFSLDSKEAIWQLQAGTSGQNTLEASFFTFSPGPPSQVYLNNNLVDSFNPADQRLSSWIKAVQNGNNLWYQPYKYKENIPTPASKEYSIVFRLAEQYLIRAEARAQQGDLIGAKEDLDKIRNRAGLAKTAASSKNEIIAAVLQERRWELFTEYGHRFFDLKRNAMLDIELRDVKKGWNSTDRLFPVPESELSTNPNLRPQNPGY